MKKLIIAALIPLLAVLTRGLVGYGNSPELQVSLMVSFNGYRMNQSPLFTSAHARHLKQVHPIDSMNW